MATGNPFDVEDAGSAFLSSSKTLADIGYTKAHAALATEQAATAKSAREENEALKRSFLSDSIADDALPSDTMPGAAVSDGASPMNILGQAPTFMKQFEQAAKYDKQYRALMSVSPKVALDLAKRRDELVAKGVDDQRAWVEQAQKNIDKVNSTLDGITGAATYNANMEQLVRDYGPGVLKRLDMPKSITQDQWDNDPQFQDKITATRQRGYDLKAKMQEDHQRELMAFNAEVEKRKAEDARLNRLRLEQDAAERRDLLRQGLEARKDAADALAEQRQVQRAVTTQRTLDNAPEVKKFPSYQQAMGQVEDIRNKVFDANGKERPNWYSQLTPADALQLKSSFAQMLKDYRDTYSTVYGEKELNKITGVLQKADAYLSTIGTGSKQWDPDTIINITGTMQHSYNLANTAVIKRDLEAVRSLTAKNGDPEQLALKGDYARFFKQNYNPKNPAASFVGVAEKDGKYYMRIGTGDKAEQFEVPKRIYDYGRR